MNLRNEVFSHSEKLWILCIGQESFKKPLTPLIDMIDWYNNQLLSKCLLKNQIKVEFGAKTLFATSGLLPVDRLMIFGIGEEKNLSEATCKSFLTEISKTLEDLAMDSPWLIFSSYVNQDFVAGVRKFIPKSERLNIASLSVG